MRFSDRQENETGGIAGSLWEGLAGREVLQISVRWKLWGGLSEEEVIVS